MNPLVPIVLGLIGAVISAVGATALARRQRSGKINTSEADDLWAEGKAMRQELRDETVVLRDEVTALRAEAAAMRSESSIMRAELLAIRSESIGLRTESAAMRAEMVALREESIALRAEAADLRHKLAVADARGRQDDQP